MGNKTNKKTYTTRHIKASLISNQLKAFYGRKARYYIFIFNSLRWIALYFSIQKYISDTSVKGSCRD